MQHGLVDTQEVLLSLTSWVEGSSTGSLSWTEETLDYAVGNKVWVFKASICEWFVGTVAGVSRSNVKVFFNHGNVKCTKVVPADSQHLRPLAKPPDLMCGWFHRAEKEPIEEVRQAGARRYLQEVDILKKLDRPFAGCWSSSTMPPRIALSAASFIRGQAAKPAGTPSSTAESLEPPFSSESSTDSRGTQRSSPVGLGGPQLAIGAMVRVRGPCANSRGSGQGGSRSPPWLGSGPLEGVITDLSAEAVKVVSVKDGVAWCVRVLLDSACLELL